MGIVRRFLPAEAGQDLVEYSLLIVFVLIAAAVFMQGTGSSVIPIWQAGSTTVQDAAVQVS